MDRWSPDDSEEIVVGRRRKRGGRRRPPKTTFRWILGAVLVLVLSGGTVALVVWLKRPSGLDAIPNPAVVAPGGFRASIGVNNTITLGLEVRNVAEQPLTLVDARIVAPAGLTTVKVTMLPTGEGNAGFTLEGDLPANGPVTLGTEAASRNAIIAARFSVDCVGLRASGAPTGEQIFVTIAVGEEQRVEQLTPPVVGDVAWLTATARRVCLDPVPTGTAEPPLPPLPGTTTTPAGS